MKLLLNVNRSTGFKIGLPYISQPHCHNAAWLHNQGTPRYLSDKELDAMDRLLKGYSGTIFTGKLEKSVIEEISSEINKQRPPKGRPWPNGEDISRKLPLGKEINVIPSDRVGVFCK